MTTIKQVHIVCKNVTCRGEYLGYVNVTGTVKIPGECQNYRDIVGRDALKGFVYGPDNWFIEMIVIESNTCKIELGYAYLKQIDDGFADAKITFSEEVDVTGKEIWIMTPEQADLIGETLGMDCESSMIDREIRDPLTKAVEAIEEYTELEGTIMLFKKEA